MIILGVSIISARPIRWITLPCTKDTRISYHGKVKLWIEKL